MKIDSDRILMSTIKVLSLQLVIASLLFRVATANATIPDDSYIAGYATAVLKHAFKIDAPSLTVQNGNITIPADKVAADDHVKIMQTLSEIPGVNHVAIAGRTAHQFPPTSPVSEEAITEEGIPTTGHAMLATGILPEGHLFKPLLADPRWAHFSATYRNYIGNNVDGNNNGAVSFGETIPFYRANIGQSMVQWEAGLQAGVFSDFNLDAPSSDLVNTDFIAAAYASLRARQASAFARVYHQSSHLGDEFLLRKLTSLERINLSFEAADLRLSYELPYGVRVYGGGGGIFRKQPSSIRPWYIQYGIEFRSPWRLEIASMRPVLAVDIKNHEQNNWNADVSARAGFQFDNLQTFDRRLQFLIEYFHGNSPTGQFFTEKVEYLGIGAHYHF
ncbi:MAG TPA: DUF1207 domain-containing protein [Nitrosomonas nitrosa]|uniref:DUF1207 domain-containing protein n=1 Tax=Nitrosomonas nitrosa TaxID=52442 RepID=A0A1I4QF57_9PROT|nr:DUF1207 domain-containing protein [Nitrosomonas nitrosa]SFM38731.1 Protein of unknown function [Nitrosomonas nitrosa]HNP51611.1 DUF1207 domain-containing protein [Nitrosomonas nitrosa]